MVTVRDFPELPPRLGNAPTNEPISFEPYPDWCLIHDGRALWHIQSGLVYWGTFDGMPIWEYP